MLKQKLERYTLVLASQSPRRKELLQLLDLDFRVVKLDADESYPQLLQGKEITEHICSVKSEAYSFTDENEIVITADTLVMTDESVLAKPADEKEAMEMLKGLSGKAHRVISSYGVRTAKQWRVNSDEALVYFRELDEEEIKYYVNTYKPYDKAGSYGIQEWIGAIGIEKIEGSFYTIMGLPTHLLYQDLYKITAASA